MICLTSETELCNSLYLQVKLGNEPIELQADASKLTTLNQFQLLPKFLKEAQQISH